MIGAAWPAARHRDRGRLGARLFRCEGAGSTRSDACANACPRMAPDVAEKLVTPDLVKGIQMSQKRLVALLGVVALVASACGQTVGPSSSEAAASAPAAGSAAAPGSP